MEAVGSQWKRYGPGAVRIRLDVVGRGARLSVSVEGDGGRDDETTDVASSAIVGVV